MANALGELPDIPEGQSLNVSAGYKMLKDTWTHGQRLLAQEDCDPVQLYSTATRLESFNDLMDLIVKEVDDEDWTRSVAVPFLTMVGSLRGAAHAMTDR